MPARTARPIERAASALRSLAFALFQLAVTPPYAIAVLALFWLPPVPRFRFITHWCRVNLWAARVICGIRHQVVGLEINANHLKGATSGWVTGIARPIHIGRSTHVWHIEMRNDAGDLTCISRITMAVLQPRPATVATQS